MIGNVLIIDDEEDIRGLLAGILSDDGLNCQTAASSQAADDVLADFDPDLIVLDVWLQGSDLDGLQYLEKLKQLCPLIPVVMISGHGTIEMAVQAIQNGAFDFIEKPFETDRLMMTVGRTLETSRLRRENRQLKQKFSKVEELLGGSVDIAQLRSLIDKVAPTNSRVLITGPAGSGKEIVAKLIHAKSSRQSAPFVTLNCATLDPDKVEQELFGVEGHAGQSTKLGLLEQADKGTLLLDEVANLPLETQAKILRVLQEQRFSRVGGSEQIEVDVRVLATTNRKLLELIESGEFREDLYYRLNVVPLTIPELRKRRADIPALVKYFNEKFAQTNGLSIKNISLEASAVLQTYDWPGNTRQLKNVVEWINIMAANEAQDTITVEMLPPEITATKPANGSSGHVEIMTLPLKDAREAFERDYLLTQVERFGGNISRTSEFIGMERSALHRKLKSLGVNNNLQDVKKKTVGQ